MAVSSQISRRFVTLAAPVPRPDGGSDCSASYISMVCGRILRIAMLPLDRPRRFYNHDMS